MRTDKKCGATETEEHEFHQHKNFISISNVDINKIVVSNKLSFGQQDLKYFIVTKMLKKLNF